MKHNNLAPDFENPIGKMIKNHRIEKEWTKTDLSFYTGLSRSYISDVESGKADLTFSAFREICFAMGTQPFVVIFPSTAALLESQVKPIESELIRAIRAGDFMKAFNLFCAANLDLLRKG